MDHKGGRLRIVILTGGPSSEYAVSLRTARMVRKNLDPNRYVSRTVRIGRDGAWPCEPASLKNSCDVVFIAMHGEYGEDGTIQRILERFRIPFTGSSSEASRLGMDKVRSSRVLEEFHVNTPPSVVVRKGSRRDLRQILRNLRAPLVVKPADRGSSVGVSVLEDARGLDAAVARALRVTDTVLVQPKIGGTELTVGVIERNGKLLALPPTEIVPKASKFFDYRAKYAKGASDEITPARIPGKIAERARALALRVHRALGASGYSRTDMMLENGKLWVLELNTLPGLTEASLLPNAARAARIPFPKVLDLIIEAAVRRAYHGKHARRRSRS
jgi:D-alanine-D-alanine ligase